ncbi:MAG: hypothetical protein LBE35_00300 [Clostridiales bacterium]|jgi:hypothetical protein|nr:hypothetical protein [Clostridiales bacterium]
MKGKNLLLLAILAGVLLLGTVGFGAFFVVDFIRDIVGTERASLTSGDIVHFHEDGTHGIYLEADRPPTTGRHGFTFTNIDNQNVIHCRAPFGTSTYSLGTVTIGGQTVGDSYLVEFAL